MAYSNTVDERTAGGFYTYSAGYYDTSNLLNDLYVIAANDLAYGTLVDDYTTADIDVYSLGILSPGIYEVDVDDHTWDYFNYDTGFVSSYSILNSLGYIEAQTSSTLSNLNFTVYAPETYYLKIEGPFYGEAQYTASYEKISELLNYPAIFSNPTYSGDLTVGSTVSTDVDYIDLDLNSDNTVATFWYIDDDGNFSNGGWESLSDYTSFNGTIQIQSDWVGKTLYFSKAFYDDQGNFETSFLPPAEPYKIGNITAPNTEAIFSNPSYSGNLTVGSIISSDIDISDPDGNSNGEVFTGWVLDSDADWSNGGFEVIPDLSHEQKLSGMILIESDWVGKTLYFVKGFVDDLGNAEASWDGIGAEGLYLVGTISQDTSLEFLSDPVTTATEDTQYTYQITASGTEGNSIEITAPVLPNWLDLVDNGDGSGTISGIPSDYFVGDNSIQLMISDGNALNYQSFNISVQDVDNDPRPIVENFELTGDNYLDMLLQGSKWIFPEGVDRVLDWAIVDKGLASWFPDEVQVTESIGYVLGKIEEFIDVSFNFLGWYGSSAEANELGSEINYVAADLDPTLYGNAFFPSLEMNDIIDGHNIGDIEFNRNIYSDLTDASADVLADFSFVLVHETGHALGLKHPHDDGASGRPTFSELGLQLLDDVLFTVMSYESAGEFANAANAGSIVPYTPMMYDIPALQYLYGTPTENVNSGDTTYEIDYAWFDYVMSYDPNGTDTISAENSSGAVFIAINNVIIGDEYLSYSVNADEQANLNAEQPTFSRADGVIGIIENVIGSAYGDTISDGLINSISSEIYGGAGDDIIVYYGGNDIIYGGADFDTLILEFPFSNVQSLSLDNGIYTLDYGDYSPSFSEIEEVRDSNSVQMTVDQFYAEYTTDQWWKNVTVSSPLTEKFIHSPGSGSHRVFEILENSSVEEPIYSINLPGISAQEISASLIIDDYHDASSFFRLETEDNTSDDSTSINLYLNSSPNREELGKFYSLDTDWGFVPKSKSIPFDIQIIEDQYMAANNGNYYYAHLFNKPYVSILNVNEPPVSQSDMPDKTIFVGEDVYNLGFNFIDEDTFEGGDFIRYTASGLPEGFSIDFIGGEINGEATLENIGIYEVIVTATDSFGLEGYETFGLEIKNSNEPPSLTSADTSTVEENASTDTVVYDAESTDPDDDSLTYTISGSDASYVTIDSDDGEVRLLNPADYETKDSYTFDVTASDGQLSDTKTVTVNVNDVDETDVGENGDSAITNGSSEAPLIVNGYTIEPGADLSGADLSGINLSLVGDLLTGINFSGANLSGAILSTIDNVSPSFSYHEAVNLNDFSGLNFTGANLTGAKLSGAYLSGANFSGADLTNAIIEKSDLAGANFENANLQGCDFREFNLEGVNLSGLNLSGSDIRSVNLSGMDLSGSDLRYTDFRNTDLSSADLTGVDLSDAVGDGANLSGADLTGADLTNAFLNPANLTGANLIGVNLSNANLEGANLSGANLTGVDLSSMADLTNATLTDANLTDAIYSHLILTQEQIDSAITNGSSEAPLIVNGYTIEPGADLSGADLSGINLSLVGDLLTGINFSGANLSGAILSTIDNVSPSFSYHEAVNLNDFSGLNFTGANLTGAKLSGAYLSGANFSGADLTNAIIEKSDLAGANFENANLQGCDFRESQPRGC